MFSVKETSEMKYESFNDAIQHLSKQNPVDEIISVRDISVTDDSMVMIGDNRYPMLDVGADSLLKFLRIPKKYAKIVEPDHLAYDVNTLLGAVSSDTDVLVRMINGDFRSINKSTWTPVDNNYIIEALVSADLGHEVFSIVLNASKMTILMVSNDSVAPVKGDETKFGLFIQNSEIQWCSFSMMLSLFQMVCSNITVAPNKVFGGAIAQSNRPVDSILEDFEDRLDNPTYSKVAILSSLRTMVDTPLTDELLLRHSNRMKSLFGTEGTTEIYDELKLADKPSIYNFYTSVTRNAKSLATAKSDRAYKYAGNILYEYMPTIKGESIDEMESGEL